MQFLGGQDSIVEARIAWKTTSSASHREPNNISRVAMIAVPVIQGDAAFGEGVQYNSMSQSASSSLTESGIAYVTVEKLTAVANAKTVAIKIEGAKRAAVYDEKDIFKTFLPNLALFFAEKIEQ